MSDRIADLSTFSCPILRHISKFIVPGLKKESLTLFSKVNLHKNNGHELKVMLNFFF